MTGQSLLREARALVFGLVCLSLSVTLHSAAHGGLPSLPALLAGGGLVLGIAVALAGRQRGLPAIMVATAATQVCLHEVFTLMSPAETHTMVMPSHSPAVMLAAHLVAGGLTALWLYAGEVAVWRTVQWLAHRLPTFGVLFALAGLRLLVPDLRRAAARFSEFRILVPEPVFRRSLARRGPPPALAFS